MDSHVIGSNNSAEAVGHCWLALTPLFVHYEASNAIVPAPCTNIVAGVAQPPVTNFAGINLQALLPLILYTIVVYIILKFKWNLNML
jgi:hypothetical protein